MSNKPIRIYDAEQDYWAMFPTFLAEIGLDPNYKRLTWTESLELANSQGRPQEEVYDEANRSFRQVEQQYATWRHQNTASLEQKLMARNNTIDSMSSIYQRADRILTGLNVNILFTEDYSSPIAYSDGKDITFNVSQIKTIDETTIMSLNGLNYHEVAHLLYSPRLNSKLGKWVVETHEKVTETVIEAGTPNEWVWKQSETVTYPNRLTAFNILEDNRAETYLSNKYPSVRPFLIATVGEHITHDRTNLADSFVLLCGRKYFSLETRQLSANAHTAKYGLDRTKKIFNIVNEYRTLVYPRQYDRGIELIQELADLLPENTKGGGCSPRRPLKAGRPRNEKEQDGCKWDIDGDDIDLDCPDGKDGKGVSKRDHKTDKSKRSSNGEGGEGNEGGDPDNPNFMDTTNLLEQLKAEIERAKTDRSASKKVKETLNAIIKDNTTKPSIPQTKVSTYEPTDKEVTTVRLFANELERLRIECDPNWLRQVPSGKLNVRRAMNADINEIDKLFDRWRNGSDEYDIECSILVDKSGSMWNLIGSASRSGWIIKRAIEKVEGKVSLLSFNDESRIVLSRDVKAKANAVPIPEGSGGTNPEYALREANRVMEISNAKTKLVFILTDGEWGNDDKCNNLVKSLQSKGCLVTVVFLADPETIERIKGKVEITPEMSEWDIRNLEYWRDPEVLERLKHNADIFSMITDPKDLVKVAREVVKAKVRTNG